MSEYKIGVDIGGTFTDVVLWDVAGGRTYNAKLLTTPDDPSRAVQEGVRRILEKKACRRKASWRSYMALRWSRMP